MELLTKTLFLCFAVGLACGAPGHHAPAEDGALPNRCDAIEFDAITPDEKGKTFFFKGAYLWKGFKGPAQLSNESFAELDDIHHIGHVDAAFRMHNEENLDDHDHIYFFLDDKVFSYYNHTLEEGYPKQSEKDFPGVPIHLDAAVECPKGECMTDSVLFFKGHDVHFFDIATRKVKVKTWSHLPVCTSAFRWLQHYYCFHGHNFTRFHPVTGETNIAYPKDARKYFTDCPDFGHRGNRTAPKCSEMKIDAITSDDAGKTYLFTGNFYVRLDTRRDGVHPFPITTAWKEVTHGVDAVFSYSDRIYMIKDNEVFIYKAAAHYTLIDGYPKTLTEEFGIEGPVNAAFVCPGENTVHIIKGSSLYDVDLVATPRTTSAGLVLPMPDVDGALCDARGVDVFKGSQFYHYVSTTILAVSKIAIRPTNITSERFPCED